MNYKQLARTSIINLIYTFGSQGISLILSVILTLLMPKQLGVTEFGYWQLFLFYSGYVGFFHFGLNDGINLKYGGMEYNKLNKEVLRSQLYVLSLSQLLIALGIIISSLIMIDNTNRLSIMIFTSLYLIICNIEIFFWYTLQASNRIKEYSLSVIAEKIVMLLTTILLLSIHINEFEIYIVFNILSKLVGLLLSMGFCRDLLIGKILNMKTIFSELVENLSSGAKLMFSNIASMLIIGNGRFIIDKVWGIESFSKVSFSFTLSTMVLLFINAVSIMLFPTLKRIPKANLSSVYKLMSTGLMVLLTGALLFYMPLKQIIGQWLPEYKESFKYMAIVFPLCIFDGKMQMLIVTNLKVIRREGILLKSNIISLLLSVLLCIFCALVIDSMISVIISIAIVIVFRSIIAEWFLSRELNIFDIKNLLSEIGIVIIFTLCAWYIDGYISMFIYSFVYIVFIFLHRKSILRVFSTMKKALA
ncbi:hypothetical protein ABEX78_25040 [Priestia megaterium]